jgi:hypothetical protein
MRTQGRAAHVPALPHTPHAHVPRTRARSRTNPVCVALQICHELQRRHRNNFLDASGHGPFYASLFSLS